MEYINLKQVIDTLKTMGNYHVCIHDVSGISYHWAVQNLKNYADLNYSRTFTLESVCRLYFVNEKYAGKLFKEQTGLSFHEYLTDISLGKPQSCS